MDNFRIKIGMKEIIIAVAVILLYGIIKLIPPEGADIATFILTVVATIGIGIYYFLRNKKKKNFPAYFAKPDQEQAEYVAKYYKRLDMQMERKKNEPLFILPIFVFVAIINIFLWWFFWMVLYFLIYLLVFLGVASVVELLWKLSRRENKKIEAAGASDYEIARVEYYDSERVRPMKSLRYYCYVYVRFGEETMKLLIPESIYREVHYKSSGVGYLVKYPKGKGLFDMYDFIPVIKTRY